MVLLPRRRRSRLLSRLLAGPLPIGMKTGLAQIAVERRLSFLPGHRSVCVQSRAVGQHAHSPDGIDLSHFEAVAEVLVCRIAATQQPELKLISAAMAAAGANTDSRGHMTHLKASFPLETSETSFTISANDSANLVPALEGNQMFGAVMSHGRQRADQQGGQQQVDDRCPS